jgi:STE24 endopeptidase
MRSFSSDWRRSPGARLGLTAVAMAVAAEGAVLLLAPSEQGIPPVPIEVGNYLDPSEVAAAVDYRDGQRLLLVAGLGAQLVAVGALALGRPRSARRALAALSRRRWAGPAAAGALVVAVAELAALPAALAAHERAVDVGIATQSLGQWLYDYGRSALIGGTVAAGGATILCGLVRRFPRGWWLPAAGGIIGLGTALTLLAPILIAPQFNDFERLPEGSTLRADVLELGERAGVDIGEVYRIDASRRSSTLNAYVSGLGPTKRVVLYDNLIDDAEPAELESVVAHELAHVAHADVPRGIAFAAIVAPFGLLFARELAGLLTRRAGAAPGTPASVPALLLSIAAAAFALNVPANQLSRDVEASADAFALRITEDPQALIDLQVRLARANLSDPDPPAISRVLFGTHPTTTERIGSALAWERGAR